MTRTALYRHRDKNGTLLYVGISLSVPKRLAEHMRRSPWAEEITRVDIAWYPSRHEAEAAERHAIRTEAPRWNIAHNTPQARSSRFLIHLPERRFQCDEMYGMDGRWRPRGFGYLDDEAKAEEFVRAWAANLREKAKPFAVEWDEIRRAYVPGLSFESVGHRFWLSLTDREFEAAAHSVCAELFMYWMESTEHMEGPHEWSHSARCCWDGWWTIWETWGERRKEIAERWPHLAKAAA
jgi:predicted GIY-YIG superfamily endonuclease